MDQLEPVHMVVLLRPLFFLNGAETFNRRCTPFHHSWLARLESCTGFSNLFFLLSYTSGWAAEDAEDNIQHCAATLA